jgi:hypothetical protein
MNVNEIRTTPPQVSTLKPAQKKPATSFESELQKNAPTDDRSQRADKLTNSERSYFQDLFPQSAEEIRRYNPYQRDGVKNEVRLGTLLDRRG